MNPLFVLEHSFYQHFDVVGLCLGRNLASDQTLPGFLALVDDFHSILLVLGLTAESENVFRLSVRDFVDPEPFVGRTEQAREVLLNVLDVWRMTQAFSVKLHAKESVPTHH